MWWIRTKSVNQKWNEMESMENYVKPQTICVCVTQEKLNENHIFTRKWRIMCKIGNKNQLGPAQ